MPATFEELRVLQEAEKIADDIWKQVLIWKEFERDVVGKQLTRAVDSIGANIAEAYGRYHFGEKLQFLYYARGSLFESKYWLNRAMTRALMPATQVADFALQITNLARQLNAYAKGLKEMRSEIHASRNVHEQVAEYITESPDNSSEIQLFDDDELKWLQSSSPLTNN